MDLVNVGGYRTFRGNRNDLAGWIASACLDNRASGRAGTPPMVFSSNGQGIALRGHDPAFDAAMAAADVVHADGMPVVLASRLLTRQPIAERAATTDLFHDVAEHAIRHDLGFFVLGGSEDLNARATEAMRARYPGLRIVGRHHGFFGPGQDAEICREITAAGTDVLWVGLGKPLQEVWSHRNRDALRGVGCIKTCGGLFSFLTGDTKRAPRWMQAAGLEWFYRFAREPRRLFRRYLVTNSISAWRLLTRTG